ncbi:MAG: toll/interleukin-1 receptor domain-containing protein [Chloroflexi bacterium]|nr:toll/interleukin-1 receptor domain-containing protein [Chloroflexota bacterium]
MSDVFISYSRKDTDFVRKLFDALQGTGRDAWVDWEGIPYSVDWWQEICRGIDGAETFVFVISPDSMSSMICNQEVAYARQNNKRLIPILHREVDENAARQAWRGQEWAATAEENWISVKHLNWLFLRDGDSFDGVFRDLIATVERDPEHLQDHTRLLVRAREWLQNDRNPSFLLRGDDLLDADQWLSGAANREPYPLQLHTEYIFASRQAERKRQRNILVGVASALGVTVLLLILSFVLYQDANRQRAIAEDNYRELLGVSEELRSEALNAYSIAQEDNDIELSFLLSVEANRVSRPSANARTRLARFLQGVGWTGNVSTVSSKELITFVDSQLNLREFTPDERERFNIE